jgi:hypothetical protein
VRGVEVVPPVFQSHSLHHLSSCIWNSDPITEMAAPPRTPFTDALTTLGTILPSSQTGQCDGVHVPVLRVHAAHPLYPNQDVGVTGPGASDATAHAVAKLGKVDPFLTKAVARGQGFWMVLYPGQITTLRHVWEHPMIPTSAGFQPDAAAASSSSPAVSGSADSDKRSVDTDAKLGQVAPTAVRQGGGNGRDAVHWAVKAVVAAETLAPNEDVGFLSDGRIAATDKLGARGPLLGKVDPFLSHEVAPGETCWFVMYPGQVHSLRHDWEHPRLKKTVREVLPPPEEASAAPNVPHNETVGTTEGVTAENTTPPSVASQQPSSAAQSTPATADLPALASLATPERFALEVRDPEVNESHSEDDEEEEEEDKEDNNSDQVDGDDECTFMAMASDC